MKNKQTIMAAVSAEQQSFSVNNAERREQMRKVTAEMVSKMRWILDHDPADGLRWKGTKTDLLEMIYEVFVSGDIMMDNGTMASLTFLVSEVFSIMHVTPLSNPRSVISRARQRKGLRSQQLTERLRQRITMPSHYLTTFWEMLIGKSQPTF